MPSIAILFVFFLACEQESLVCTVDTSAPEVFLIFKHIAFEHEGGADGIETFLLIFLPGILQWLFFCHLTIEIRFKRSRVVCLVEAIKINPFNDFEKPSKLI